MLRKNNLGNVRQGIEKCSSGSQTDEFLLYLAMQQKIESVYNEYRELQVKYDQASRLIEYLQYKNKYLQTSLCEISIAFNHNITRNNVHYIQEIKNLDQIIKRETQELNNHQDKYQSLSIFQEEAKKDPLPNKLIKSKNSSGQTIKSKSIEDPISILKYRKISPMEQSNSQEDRPALGESQNQFLPDSALSEKRSTVNCESERYQNSNICNQSQKYATSRHHAESKTKKSSTKRNHPKIGKENINYQKLVRIQAELKMKEFMQKFQMDSRLRQPFDSSIYNEQMDYMNYMQQQSASCASAQ